MQGKMGKMQFITSNIAQNQQYISAYQYPIVPTLYPQNEERKDDPQLCPLGDIY
jgi:hypothetical protein